MPRRSRRILGLALMGVLLILSPRPAQASVMASSNLTVSNLQISPANGTVVFTDPFSAQAFAQAQNSLGELDNHFDSQVGAPASADGRVTWITAHGGANPLNRSENVSSGVNLPGTSNAAGSSTAQGTLSNTFMITGGSGSVQVRFSADLIGSLLVLTDPLGQLAQTEVNLSLLLPDLAAPNDTVLFEHRLLSVGPNSSARDSIAETLTGSRTLQFNTPYLLLLQADSESSGINVVPEPGTITLLCMGGLAGLARYRRLRKGGSRS